MITNPEHAQDVALRAAAWARAQLRGDRDAMAALRPATMEEAEDMLIAATGYMLVLAEMREDVIDALVQVQLKHPRNGAQSDGIS
ncbi:hypothetical protein [Pseudarthrobacter sp. NS4]|uniref:hypothetical protein n=1 Tax=Pseudarthrobacter sp. NS4 TaxID=2973976 RepID=UPI0021614EC6|nr:hypothetical protein [Pseudarthrobacter sp. NS4]